MTVEYKEVVWKETLLKIEDVHLKLGGRVILRDVQAEIKNVVRPGLTQGQVVAFLGPSGRGKTKLFELMAGLRKPTSGKIQIVHKGKETRVREGLVGVVSQFYTLFLHHRVSDNLLIAGRKGGLSEKDARDKARQLLERFQLLDRWDEWPKNLSGGQRQRVAIVQQLLCSDHYLLMDEPFSGLDPNNKDEACHLVQEVAALDEDLTIVVVTHDIESGIKIADRVWLLGFDRAEDGSEIPGARIQEDIDLVSLGLAWQPEMEELPGFNELKRRIKKRFKTL